MDLKDCSQNLVLICLCILKIVMNDDKMGIAHMLQVRYFKIITWIRLLKWQLGTQNASLDKLFITRK